jgi:hypothetical protein
MTTTCACCAKRAGPGRRKTPAALGATQLALALIEGKIVQQAAALCDAYRQAFSEIGTAREHPSVLEHLDFIIQILAPKGAQAETVAALSSIRDQLKKTIEASSPVS